MVQQLYLTADNESGDDFVTFRVDYKANEPVTDLMKRVKAAGAADPVVQGDRLVAGLLRADRYFLSIDQESPFKDAKITKYPPGGDLYLVATEKPATCGLYLHTEDKTFRYDLFVAGETTVKDVLMSLATQLSIPRALATKVVIPTLDDGSRLDLDPEDILPTFTDNDMFVEIDTDAWKATDPASFAKFMDLPSAPSKKVDEVESDDDAPPALVGKDDKPVDAPAAAASSATKAKHFDPKAAAPLPKEQQLSANENTETMAAADAHISANRYVMARKLLGRITKENKEDYAKARVRMGKLLVETRKYSEAAKEFQAALDAHPRYLTAGMELGKAFYEGKKYSDAIDAFKDVISSLGQYKISNDAMRKEAVLRLGGALYSAGKENNQDKLVLKGIDTVQSNLGGDVSNSLGVLWMSRFYADRGLWQDAISAACRVLGLHWQDPKGHPDVKEYKANLADIMKRSPDPISHLKGIYAAGNTSTISIELWGFFAVNCRDHGMMKESLELYEFARTLEPHNANHALAYAHSLENNGEHVKALKFMLSFAGRANKNVDSLTAKAVLDAVGDLSDLPNKWPASKLEDVEATLSKPRQNVRFTDEKLTVHDSYEDSQEVPIGKSSDSPLIGEGSQAELGEAKLTYTEEKLYLLGLYFTIVKNLFIVGALHKLPPLLALLNPYRVGKSLHRTLIRNEHAYYLTVAAIMQYHDFHRGPEVTVPKPEGLIYMCGDSHSLPPSWQTLDVQGKTYRLVNAVVTGLKIWHLRDGSEFYPKKNFEAVTAAIPKGSDVMFMFGEIDCRDGIMTAVDRGLYDGLEAAMNVIADIYVKRLLSLKKRFNRIFVHFPLPVINVTSTIVLRFCKVLEAKMAPYRDQLIVVYCHVVGDSPTGNPTIRSDLVLDQTHISPTYVPQVLQNAVTGAVLASLSAQSAKK